MDPIRNNNSLSARQSELIKAMRFPLICLVIIAHSAGTFSSSTIAWSLDGWNIFHFVSEMISRHFCSVGTCWFFVFSGFLFFFHLKDDDFSFDWVKAKWKKRVRSLLVPHLFWNLMAVLAICVVTLLFQVFSITGEAEEMMKVRQGPVYWFFSGPIDFPLWFLRDLIILTLFAPLIYLIFRRFKWTSLALLVLVYLSPWNPAIPTMRSIFFFSIGVWLGTHKVNLLQACQKVRIPAFILAFLLLFISTSQLGRPMHTFLIRLFYPCGMVVFMLFCNSLIDNQRRSERLCTLSSCVFFIYASHEIYILGWTKGVCLRLFGESLGAAWLRYLITPFIVIGICLLLYRVLNRLIPNALSIACGGRSKK